MKIKNLVPVTGDVMSPEIVAYMTKYLRPDTEVDTGRIKKGPLSIESEYDEALAAPEVIAECIQAEKDGFDGVFVNCFGDPGVRGARECVNIPVFGGFEPAIHLALGLSDKLSIVTVLKNVLPLIEGNVAKAHLEHRIVSVRSVDIPVLELHDSEKLCGALVAESIKAIEQDGAGAIVLGCTCMIDVSEAVQAKLAELGYQVPVVEAAQSAVMLLEVCSRMGLRQSRVTYMPPRMK